MADPGISAAIAKPFRGRGRQFLNLEMAAFAGRICH